MLYSDYQGEHVSRLGFGLMRLPVIDGDQSKVDVDKVEEMILYALEHGVTYFDTAYPYHNGFSEKTLGTVMANNHIRGKMTVATKLFTLGMERPEYDPRKMLEEQLNRLQTDHIDFYLMHGLHGSQWAMLRDKFDAKNWLRGLKEQGVIRHLGFSFHDDTKAFRDLLEDFEWEFAQIQYNYLDHEIQAGDEGVAFAYERGTPLVVMEPLKGGNLIFSDYPAVQEIRKKYGLENMSGAELGLSYVFNNPAFMTVLSGMSTLDQVKENVEIAGRRGVGCLTPEMSAAIDEIRQLIASSEGIPCTGCRYCVEGCPMHIQIPTAFSLYNEGKKFHNPQAQLRNYNRSCANLADCISCGQCMDACPQHLKIPELLLEVRNYLG